MLERYVDDQRLIDAIACQGTIGTFAGPRDPGTASIRLMHHQGDLLGLGSVWGYVEGGLGRVSFAIAEAALEAGATLAAGVPVAAIHPGEGVELESGERSERAGVICNADPKRLLAMLDAGDAAVPAGLPRPARGLGRALAGDEAERGAEPLPDLHRGAGGRSSPERAMVTITDGVDAAQAAVEAARGGEPAFGFCELYFQSAYDPSVAPPGREVMSVFCQYAPYELADGRLGLAARRDRRPGARRDRAPRPRRARLHRGAPGPSARPTSRSGSGSPAATSSRARRCRARCGTAGSRRGRPSTASTCAAPPPTRAAR